MKFYFIELLHEGRWEAPCCYTLLLRHTVDTLCRELGSYYESCVTMDNHSLQIIIN